MESKLTVEMSQSVWVMDETTLPAALRMVEIGVWVDFMPLHMYIVDLTDIDINVPTIDVILSREQIQSILKYAEKSYQRCLKHCHLSAAELEQVLNDNDDDSFDMDAYYAYQWKRTIRIFADAKAYLDQACTIHYNVD